jgi:hypothetical protein
VVGIAGRVLLLTAVAMFVFVGCGSEDSEEPTASGDGVQGLEGCLEEAGYGLGDAPVESYLSFGPEFTGGALSVELPGDPVPEDPDEDVNVVEVTEHDGEFEEDDVAPDYGFSGPLFVNPDIAGPVPHDDAIRDFATCIESATGEAFTPPLSWEDALQQ